VGLGFNIAKGVREAGLSGPYRLMTTCWRGHRWGLVGNVGPDSVARSGGSSGRLAWRCGAGVHRQATVGRVPANGAWTSQVGTDPTAGGCGLVCWLCPLDRLLDTGRPRLIAALPKWCL